MQIPIIERYVNVNGAKKTKTIFVEMIAIEKTDEPNISESKKK